MIRMEESRGAGRNFVGRRKGKRQLGRPSLCREITIK